MKDRKPRKSGSPAPKEKDIIRLEDLAPRGEVRGGGAKRLFGEEPVAPPDRRSE
jgi:hypothetical protein